MAGRSRFLIALTLTVLLKEGHAKIFSPCDLAQKLLHLGAERSQLAEWVCIASHESGFKTTLVKEDVDGSKNHGIYQISDKIWCNKGSGGCNVACHLLLNCYISDDFACAQLIYRETESNGNNGFTAWATYDTYCRGGQADQYIEECQLI